VNWTYDDSNYSCNQITGQNWWTEHDLRISDDKHSFPSKQNYKHTN